MSVTRANEFLHLEATNLCNVLQDVCGAADHHRGSWFNQMEVSLLAAPARSGSVLPTVALATGQSRHRSQLGRVP
jgi:hypothetical protein